jgi:hypothetical protein
LQRVRLIGRLILPQLDERKRLGKNATLKNAGLKGRSAMRFVAAISSGQRSALDAVIKAASRATTQITANRSTSNGFAVAVTSSFTKA